MSALPNFENNGYQVTELLYQNIQAGRNTYKAIELNTQKLVIIKQFCFAQKTWEGYKEIEREINVLKSLNNSGIPKYIDTFDSDNGLCLVQEYIQAEPLSKNRSFSPEEIKSIAVQLLEILVYLQERIPPIIHRDIKPENILVDDQIKVSLIDFGLARIGSNTMAFSSMMGGTLGFMPPEQIHNQKLTEASDLYGLGATLICLITQTKSVNIGELVDFSTNKINFKERVPKYSFKFIQWLEKMVEPNPSNRFQNAQEALKALQPLYVMRIPEIKVNKKELNFVAQSIGEKLSQTIMIRNDVPDTILEGSWSVLPHKNDPPHTPDSHSWIKFSPKKFKDNDIKCTVNIDTSKLKADRVYKRVIVLNTNGKEENCNFSLKLKTAKINLNVPIPPYDVIINYMLFFIIISSNLLYLYRHNQRLFYDLALILGNNLFLQSSLFLNGIPWIIGFAYFGMILGAIRGNHYITIAGLIFGSINGFILYSIKVGLDWVAEHGLEWLRDARNLEENLTQFGSVTGGVVGVLIIIFLLFVTSLDGGQIREEYIVSFMGSLFIVYFIGALIGEEIIGGMLNEFRWRIVDISEDNPLFLEYISFALMGLSVGFAVGFVIILIVRLQNQDLLFKEFQKKEFSGKIYLIYILTMWITSILTSVFLVIDFNAYLFTALVGFSSLLMIILLYPPIKLLQLKNQYRQNESKKLIDS